MLPHDTFIFTLLIGFVLGVRHAFEGDHVAAVSTIVSDYKNPFRASLIGTFWGIGHTTTLFTVGIIVLLFNISISDKISIFLEFFVGVMLVILGIRTLYKSNYRMRTHVHGHTHTHEGKLNEHTHPHVHNNAFHRHHRSFFIGVVHGLAGSGALMLLVLSTINSTIEGLYYILIFGAGSIIGMTVMSFFIGLPFIYSTKKFPHLERVLKITTGIFSTGFGLYIMYQTSQL